MFTDAIVIHAGSTLLRNVTILINDCGRAEFSERALADILQRFLTVRYPAAAICC